MPTYSPTGYPHIYVYNDDAVNPYYVRTVIEALGHINAQPIGANLLTTISNAPIALNAGGAGNPGFKTRIQRPNVVRDMGQDPGTEGGSRAMGLDESEGHGKFNHGVAGAGTSAYCIWNPNIFNTPNGYRPPFVALAHELIHCYHMVTGQMRSPYAAEEEWCVGLGPYMLAAITENRIRLEHNIPIRHHY